MTHTNGSRKRATHSEVVERIDLVKEWLLEPLDKQDAVQRAVDSWELSISTARKYVQRASDEMERVIENDEADYRARLADLRDKAEKYADFKAAILATVLLAKADGVEAADSVVIWVDMRHG
jgi:hypothetical protein